MQPPLVVGIGGSLGASSVTNRLLADCLAMIEDLGARTRSVAGPDLAGLPIFTGTAEGDVAGPLLDAVRAADCVVIATPGYHGGMSGMVKNALDHLELLRDDDRPYLDGRAVGVIVSAAGWQAVGTALDSVRATVHALRGWPTPFGLTVNSAEQVHEGGFDERVLGGMRVLARQVYDFATWKAASAAR